VQIVTVQLFCLLLHYSTDMFYFINILIKIFNIGEPVKRISAHLDIKLLEIKLFLRKTIDQEILQISRYKIR